MRGLNLSEKRGKKRDIERIVVGRGGDNEGKDETHQERGPRTTPGYSRFWFRPLKFPSNHDTDKGENRLLLLSLQPLDRTMRFKTTASLV